MDVNNRTMENMRKTFPASTKTEIENREDQLAAALFINKRERALR